MAGRAQGILISTTVFLAWALLLSPPAAGDDTTYDQWIAAHWQYGGNKFELKLVQFQKSMAEGTVVSTDGKTTAFSRSDWAGESGDGEPLSPDDLKKLKALLPHLPDDRKQLPPDNRALLLQGLVGDQVVTRVYDRANTPDAVWQIVQLAHCNIMPWVQKFPPQNEIDIFGGGPGGTFCLSRDGGLMFFALCDGAGCQIWNTAAREFVAESPRQVEVDVYGLSTFNPKGNLAVLGGASGATCIDTEKGTIVKKLELRRAPLEIVPLNYPEFTPDGRYLLLTTGEPSLKIYDTTTWENVTKLPEVPSDALRYFPSVRADRAVVESNASSLFLWNPATQATVASLRKNARYAMLAFSPDAAQVAAVTVPTDGHASGERLGIWATDSGKPLLEIEPSSWGTPFGYHCLAWSPDGQYLLSDTSLGIGIINAKTGRLRGELAGGLGKIVGFGLIPKTGQVAAGFEDGRIRFWDLNAALQQIKALEISLPN